MSNRLTFIHSGDLHLGAPFRGLRSLSSNWAQRLSRAIPEAYDCVIQACLDNKVDFLLLAGDMFDTDKPSYAHFRHFIQGLERLEQAQIPVYMIAGNHDPYTNWHDVLSLLPSNVRMFPSDAPGFVLHRAADGTPLCLIAARGFSNQASNGSIADGMTRADAERAVGADAPFAVGMLHSGLWMDPFKAPISEKALLATDMNYWALGHIHKRYVTPEADPHIAYCGCIQGRDIKETGARGCWLVTLEEGMPNQLKFIPTAQVEWEQLHVDVSACTGIDDIHAACIRTMFDANAKAHCEEMVVRLTLEGSTPLYDVLATTGTIEEMRNELNISYPTFYCDALINNTTPPFDKAALASAGLFPAVLLRSAGEMCSSSENQGEGAQTSDKSFEVSKTSDESSDASKTPDESSDVSAVADMIEDSSQDAMSDDAVDAGMDLLAHNPYASPAQQDSFAAYAAKMKKTNHHDTRMDYLQEEFVKRGQTIPRSVGNSLDELTESACDMVLALLDGRDA